MMPSLAPTERLESDNGSSEAQPRTTAAASLSPVKRNNVLRPILSSELILMLKGQRLWWYAIAVLLFAISLLAHSLGVRSAAAAVAWLWPVLIWSQMGAREARNATESLICSESVLNRQLPAVWLAGVIVALLTGGGMGLSLLFNREWHGVAAWIAGAFFIPSLALAFGVWTGTSKPFEAFYTAFCIWARCITPRDSTSQAPFLQQPVLSSILP